MTPRDQNRRPSTICHWDPANPERPIDVFVREPLDLRAMLAHAVIKDLDDVPIPVASIPHLIAPKQIARRLQDLDDIRALRGIAAETGRASA